MAKYVGITIGPIYDTMMLSSKPAAMWAASFLFSYLGRALCVRMQDVYNDCEIIVPYADFDMMQDNENPLVKMNQGVGLIHDRIIALVNEDKSDKEIITEVKHQVIDPVRDELVASIISDLDDVKDPQAAKEELKYYFQIYAVCVDLTEGEQIVPVISSLLDVFELEKQYICESRNDYLYDFLGSNKIIKYSFLAKDLDETLWQLTNKDKSIKAIEDIAGDRNYYALVQADGDGMGKVLKGLTTPEQVKAFSEKCISYAAKSSEIIGKYGGVTIYAGGDDLLFLAPIAVDDVDLLSLICKLRAAFAETFHEVEYKECHVSYGVQIVYKTFPLYEAFDMVSKQLFYKAKAKRNSCAVAVQKHSGQSIAFTLNKFDENPVTAALIELIKAKDNQSFILSASKHFINHINLIRTGIDNGCIGPMIDNLFDNEMQKKYKDDLERVKILLKLTSEHENDISVYKNVGLPVIALLRYADFYAGGGNC